jgi:hypothetical protein
MIKLYTNNEAAEKHYQIVKPLIQEWITKVKTRKYVRKDGQRHYLTAGLKTYLTALEQGDNSLQPLICAHPSNFEGIIDYMQQHHPGSMQSGHADNIILGNIFLSHTYDDPKFKKLDFIKRIELDTCPYCNRSYIYHVKSGNIKPQLDHFFPQTTFPFLGASIYNLIPCCQTCNGLGVKAQNDPRMIGITNPYLIEIDQFRFTFEVKDIKFLNPLADKESIEIRFKNAIRGHLTAFGLSELYGQHTDHVLELIVKSQVSYSEKYRDYLRSYPGFDLSNKEIDRLILGNYSTIEEVHKRPLAKLYQDTGRKLKLID